MSAPAASGEFVMAAKVAAKPVRLHRAQAPSAAFRLYAGLALEWGCSVKTVECLLTGERSIIRRTADALARAVALGEIERVATWLDVIEAPLWGSRALPAYDAVRLEAWATDVAEDQAECEYERNPCKETAEALVKKSAADRFKAEERERALKAKWGLL